MPIIQVLCVTRLRRKLFVTEETLYSYITFNQPNLVINVSYTCLVCNFIKISSFSFPSILKHRFDFPTSVNVLSFAIMSDRLSHISSRELGNSYDFLYFPAVVRKFTKKLHFHLNLSLVRPTVTI